MRLRHRGGLVLAGSLLAACSSASRPPAQGDDGQHDASSSGGFDGSTAGDSAREGGEDAASDAHADTGTGDDGSLEGGGDGGDGGDGGTEAAPPSDAGPPPPPPPVCDPNAVWSTGQLLAVSTQADDSLDAVTADELSILWTSGTGATAVLLYADRAAATDPFGAPQTVASGAFAVDRAAMSPDGLRIVVVNSDGQGFSELTRASRTAPNNIVGAPSTGTYGNLDGVLPAGESYGDPVLSADDHAFYYSVYGAGTTDTIRRSARLFAGDSWPPAGVAIGSSPSLEAQGSLRRQPTGIASDGQTLFFWDQVSATERAAFIDETTGDFSVFIDLGARAMAAPGSSCHTLYYSAAGASSLDLFVATH
jgi:hypothetical protein